MKKIKSYNLLLFTYLVVCFLFIGKSMDVEAAGKNLSTATPVSLNSTFSGKLTSNSQGDYYKFSISNSSIIQISAETNGHKEHCGIRLFDSEGNVITNNAGDYFFFTDDDANWGYQQGSQKCGLNAGTYYVVVYKNSGSDVNYRVIVEDIVKGSSTVKVAGYKNNYLSTAVSFSVGNKLTSVATNGFNGLDWDECHFYKFKVPTKRTVILKFNIPVGNNNDQVWFDIYNSSGKVIDNDCSCDDDPGDNNAKFQKVLDAGTYYIGVTTPDSYVRYTIKTAYKPYATQITGLSSSNKSITVKWNEKSNITGYQIQYSRNSDFSNSKKVKVSSGNTSKTITGLTASKKYYVRIRTYKTAFSSTYYSSWSDKKSITVKTGGSITPEIKLSASTAKITVGNTKKLTATTTPSGKTVKWKSSDTTVASVDSNGKVKAKKAGTAQITAYFTYNGKKAQAKCKVTVVKKPVNPSVKITGGSTGGSTCTLSATTVPANASVKWTSSNTSVAIVSGGKVTAKGAGTTTIKASITYDNKTYSASRTITVSADRSYGSWSSWTTNSISASSTREVRTTKLYRYYYYYCPRCGGREPFTGTSDCHNYTLSGSDWHEGWFTTSYANCSPKSYSYTKIKKYTESLGDGKRWNFSVGNLYDTAVGTKDSDSSAVVIKTGYSYRSVSTSYRISGIK